LRTPPAYVVDTSVVVKWYANEGGADQAAADQLLDALGQGGCILRAPEILLFELANALMLSHRFPSAKVVGSINHFQELKIELNLLSWSTLAKAVELASNCGATIYDCYFLALALESDSVLITADEVFLRKTRHWPKIIALRSLQLPEPTR